MSKERRPPRPPKQPKDPDAEEIRKLVEEEDRRRAEETERWEQEYLKLLERYYPRDGHGEHETPQTPWLLLRYAAGDIGLRPIPPGEPFWISPDIWVESSDPYGNPVAGEANFLHARVFNLGAFQAAPVKVDFYWANPALGLGAANMNLIGTEHTVVDSLTSVDVRCNTPWVPVIVNNGHECTMVNSSSWIADPIISPFQPQLDRHVGQRNMNVVPGSAWQTLKFNLQMTNVFPLVMAGVVEARFDHLRVREGLKINPAEIGGLAAAFSTRAYRAPQRLTSLYRKASLSRDLAQRALRIERRAAEDEESSPFLEVEDRGSSPLIAARIGEERGAVRATDAGKQAGNLLAAGDLMPSASYQQRSAGIPIAEIVLEPQTFAYVNADVTIPGDAQPGDIWVVHLTHQARPVTAGGYSIVVLVE